MLGTSSYHEDPLCVFVFPPSLTFYADDPTTHKQIISINNPYGFHMRFRVLSTDTSKYTVSESQGMIKSLNAQDLVVRHRAVTPSNIGVSDTIKIQLFGHGQSRPLGVKEINVLLLATKPETPASLIPGSSEESFQQLNTEENLTGTARQIPLDRPDPGERITRTIFHIVVTTVCIVILSLPNEDMESEYLPSYLRVSVTMKIIAAYALGLITAVLLRT